MKDVYKYIGEGYSAMEAVDNICGSKIQYTAVRQNTGASQDTTSVYLPDLSLSMCTRAWKSCSVEYPRSGCTVGGVRYLSAVPVACHVESVLVDFFFFFFACVLGV